MRTLVAGALVAAGVAFIAPASAVGVEVRTCVATPAVAHRGITAHHIENSRGAVRAAIKAGAYFEVDLRETRDNRIVLMHDRTIGRTTTGTGKVSRLSAKQIRRHRLNDGQSVPYAGAILRMVRDSPRAHAILEFKALTPRTQRVLRGKIRNYGIANRVEVISFHHSEIADWRRLTRGITTYLIVRDQPSIALAKRNGGVHVFPRRISDSWIDRMHDRGIPFNGRLDDTPRGWDAAVRAGVTSIMTDTVSGYRRHCATSSPV